MWSHSIKSFRMATIIFVAIWLICQLILIVCYWDYPLTGDTLIYEGAAAASFRGNTWYPNDLNSAIVAEPLVNGLIIQLKLFDTFNTNKILNLLMNMGIMLSVFTIAKKLFNEKVAYISSILFCLIYSNTLIVIGTRTEIPFVFFLLLAFAILKPKWINVVLAGVSMGMAEWYRPLMPVFIPGMLVYMFYERFDGKYYLGFFVSLAVVVAGIGFFNYHQTGEYFINPSTGGANLFMTANDKASGATATHLLNDPEVAPEMPDGYNELQRDSVYKAAAVDWIKNHPVKYALLFVKKIGGLYIEDSWPDRAIMHNSGYLSVYITNKDYSSIFGMAILMFAKSIVYYIVLLLFLISVIRNRKDLLSSKGSVVLTVVLCTLATCLFVVSPTYHYPMMFAIIIWAAYEIEQRLESKTLK